MTVMNLSLMLYKILECPNYFQVANIFAIQNLSLRQKLNLFNILRKIFCLSCVCVQETAALNILGKTSV